MYEASTLYISILLASWNPIVFLDFVFLPVVGNVFLTSVLVALYSYLPSCMGYIRHTSFVSLSLVSPPEWLRSCRRHLLLNVGWPSCSSMITITIHMPQNWNLSSSVKCIFCKTRANRILVKQCIVFIADCDAQCNQKMRIVVIDG